jgi:nucleoside-diphosphate-sugar epimerase
LNVVITGGTGYIGRALCAALLAPDGGGHTLTVLSRNPDRARAQLGPGVACLAWRPDEDLSGTLRRSPGKAPFPAPTP